MTSRVKVIVKDTVSRMKGSLKVNVKVTTISRLKGSLKVKMKVTQ